MKQVSSTGGADWFQRIPVSKGLEFDLPLYRAHWIYPSRVAICWWCPSKLPLLEVPKREMDLEAPRLQFPLLAQATRRQRNLALRARGPAQTQDSTPSRDGARSMAGNRRQKNRLSADASIPLPRADSLNPPQTEQIQ